MSAARILSAYRRERQVRSLYKSWIADQLAVLDADTLGDERVIAAGEHYAALLAAPPTVRPSGLVWRAARIVFLLACFGALLYLFYSRVDQATFHFEGDTDEFSVVLSAQSELTEPTLIRTISVTGISVPPGSTDDSSLELGDDPTERISLQSLTVESGAQVTVTWTNSALILDIVQSPERSSGLIKLVTREGINSIPQLSDIELGPFASIRIVSHSDKRLAIATPIPIKRFYASAQIAGEGPRSTLRHGELSFYDTQLVRRIGTQDLLDMKGTLAAPFSLYSVEPRAHSTRVLMTGRTSYISVGPGRASLLPTRFEWWQGKPAIAVIIGGGLVLFTSLRAVLR